MHRAVFQTKCKNRQVQFADEEFPLAKRKKKKTLPAWGKNKSHMGLSALRVLQLSVGTGGWDIAQPAGTGGLDWWVQHGTGSGKHDLCIWHLLPVPRASVSPVPQGTVGTL